MLSNLSNPKFCIGCAHRSELHDSHICMHPKARKYDLVTGQSGQSFASVMRSDPYSCGSFGNWYQPLVNEDADLDDLSKIPFGKQPN